MCEVFFKNRDEAIGHIQAILEDYQIFRKPAVVRDALDIIVEAQVGISKVAKHADMDPQALAKVLSNEKTPLIDSLRIVLKALGYTFQTLRM